MMSSQKDAAIVSFSVKWSGKKEPKKYKTELWKALQTWCNNKKLKAEFEVVTASDDHALIELDPASALTELQELTGQTLTCKDGSQVTVVSIGLKQEGAQMQQSAPRNLPSSSVSDLQHEAAQPQEQSRVSSSAADFRAGEEIRQLPVSNFWYVSHIYQEEMNRIQKENGITISPYVTVKLEPNQKNGDLQKALSEFTNLVQTSLAECSDFSIPLKNMTPESCGEILNVLQKNNNKLLLTLSADKMTVCGPKQSHDGIVKSFNTTKESSRNAKTSTAVESDDTSPTISMSIKDPLVESGLTLEKSSWKIMTSAYPQRVAQIKDKFAVDFKESGIGQGKVSIKACYRSNGGNTSMESHAIRALLRQYQMILTSGFTQDYAASGFNNNAQPGYSMHNTKEPSGAAAPASGDSQDTICPICLDTFTNKTKLKCKHEFCEECLRRAKLSSGPTCPVCKDVFGMIEGDQPDGEMTWYTIPTGLPGFPQCGTICINYYIPSGIQTERHPKPGASFTGLNRRAYLPDNREGKEVLQMLKRAFDQRLIFTVGTSRTTGMENQVTWNDIHHKTSTSGGPDGFGYPDPGYLIRVREELKAKGIK